MLRPRNLLPRRLRATVSDSGLAVAKRMKNVVLLSIIIASIVVPAKAARLLDPRKGFKLMVRNMMLFALFYVFAVMYIYPRLG